MQRLIALALVPGPNSTTKGLDGAFRMFVSKRSRRNTTAGEANDVRGSNSPAVVI